MKNAFATRKILVDGLFSVVDLIADISRHLHGLKVRLYKTTYLSLIFIFKIHIVFSILSRNPKICYFLNKILLSDLTLSYCLLCLFKRISCKENATLLLLYSVSKHICNRFPISNFSFHSFDNFIYKRYQYD